MLLDPNNQVAEKFGLAFTLPADLQELYRTFGIDLQRYNGDDSWRLPMPARFLIDQKGIIRDVVVNVDHRDRTDIETTMAALKELTG